MAKETIHLPQEIRVGDYHEMDLLKDYLSQLGLRAKVYEVCYSQGGQSIGIVYLRKDKEYKALLKNIQQREEKLRKDSLKWQQ